MAQASRLESHQIPIVAHTLTFVHGVHEALGVMLVAGPVIAALPLGCLAANYKELKPTSTVRKFGFAICRSP